MIYLFSSVIFRGLLARVKLWEFALHPPFRAGFEWADGLSWIPVMVLFDIMGFAVSCVVVVGRIILPFCREWPVCGRTYLSPVIKWVP